jgi:hypothetical protein
LKPDGQYAYEEGDAEEEDEYARVQKQQSSAKAMKKHEMKKGRSGK